MLIIVKGQVLMSKEERRQNQESIMTQDTKLESDKNHKKTSHTREPRCSTGDHKAEMNRYDNMIDTKHK